MADANTVALVTGGNKGIGYEIVRQLAERGMTVLLGARDDARREAAVASLKGAGDVRGVALDVTDEASAAAAAGWIEREFGRLDVLVNNAGIGGARQQPGSADLDVVRGVFEVNYLGVINVTRAMLPLLMRSAAPRIVNQSSGLGSISTVAAATEGPIADLPASAAYVPSKSALNALTVQYAKEFRGTKVLVNAADPGYCATDLNGHRGFASPAEGARVAVRLATLPPDGPTGGFFGTDGAIPW
jgi:NAD(P)-dependent dehydrogenase (short-subunit alcohol dehydrogenase family)